MLVVVVIVFVVVVNTAYVVHQTVYKANER